MERARKYEQLTALSSAVALPNIPAGTTRAVLQAEAQVVRLRIDGLDPTTGTGMRLIVGEFFELNSTADINRARVIEETSGAKLNIFYYGTGGAFIFATGAITHSVATAAGTGTVTTP